MMKRVTTRRIFPHRRASYESQFGDSDACSSEVQRLSELAAEQQELIVQYALRDFWSEKSLIDIDVDVLTSGWLEEHFGDACTRPLTGESKASSAFNGTERLARLRQVFSWEANVVKQRGKSKESSVEQEIVDKFDFAEHIAGLEQTALSSAIADLSGDNACLRSLHAMACFLANLREVDSYARAVRVSEPQALALLLATLLIRAKRAEAHREVLDFLSDKAEFLNALEGSAQHQLRETLVWCAAAADPAEHWHIARNLDLLKVIELDDAASIFASADQCGALSGKVFTDAVLQQRILVQGAFRAALHSAVCWPAHIAAELIAREAATSKTYAGLGKKSSVLVQNLLGLNLADFVVAPLWIPLAQLCPTLQEPVAHLILNRADWSSSLVSTIDANDGGQGSFEHLRNMVLKRAEAFDKSFGHPKFDSHKQHQMQQSFPLHSVQRATTNISEDGIVRTSSVTSLPMRFHSTDFLAQQGKALSATGATDLFLSLIRSGEPREHSIQQSLACSIGFVELTKKGKISKYAREGHNGALGADAKSLTAGKLMDRPESVDSKRLKKSTGSHPNPVAVLPKSFLKKDNEKLKLAGDDEVLPRHHVIIRSVLDNQVVTSIIAFLTVFALFGDDLKLAAFPKSADMAFGYLTFLTFLVFCSEISAKVIVQPGFKLGFFFWLDILATVSLVPDIIIVLTSESSGSNADDLTLTRAGRASRAGARAARMLRILRLVRLLRIFKLYEYIAMRRERASHLRRVGSRDKTRYVAKYLIRKRNRTRKRPSNLSRPVPTAYGSQQQSKVGAKLADLTTRRVIVVVLVILFMLPLITPDEVDYSYEASAGMLHREIARFARSETSESDFRSAIDAFVMGSTKLIKLETYWFPRLPDPAQQFNSSLLFELYNATNVAQTDDLRDAELQIGWGYCSNYNSSSGEPAPVDFVYCTVDTDVHGDLQGMGTKASFDNSAFEVESAVRSICQTIFIIFIFGVATMVFTYDAHKLVIAPIEKMVRIVEELAANPLTTFENDDSDDEGDDDPTGLLSAGREAYKKRQKGKKQKKSGSTDGAYETQLLENSIKKIGGLLQVGFGEAGAEIIASNMNTSGELDPMVPGRKVQAVFGYCNIRNFMMTTEVLGEEIMLYVNEIANIVHSQVSAHSGNANRNMGDSFLVVWKRNPSENETWTQITEKALISFLKITVEVYRNQELNAYTSQDSRLGMRIREQMPDFKVALGFGLHIGWAIEGAIGSNQKIDASYLSPHVNLTGRLEEMTHKYGTSILFSGDFHELLGSDAKICSRKIDEVMLNGMNNPVALYTFDCNLHRLQQRLDAIKLKGDASEQDEESVVDRRISLIGPSPIIDHARNIAQIQKSAFRTDLDIRALQWEYPRHFMPLCRKGVAVYLAGHWMEAKTLLEASCKMFPAEKNGPSGRILRFMQQYDFQCPADWPGYRSVDKHFFIGK